MPTFARARRNGRFSPFFYSLLRTLWHGVLKATIKLVRVGTNKEIRTLSQLAMPSARLTDLVLPQHLAIELYSEIVANSGTQNHTTVNVIEHRGQGMGGTKLSLALELNANHLEWLRAMADEYALPDPDKALRIVLDYVMDEADSNTVFEEVRCNHCQDTSNQD